MFPISKDTPLLSSLPGLLANVSDVYPCLLRMWREVIAMSANDWAYNVNVSYCGLCNLKECHCFKLTTWGINPQLSRQRAIMRRKYRVCEAWYLQGSGHVC